jgi:hypothetical protein
MAIHSAMPQLFLRFWRALLQVVDGLMMPTTST